MSDRVEFSIKQRFIERNGDNPAYRQLMGSPIVLDAVRDTLAEMAWRGFSAEQINGACAFAKIMLNLSEPDEKPQPLPIKQLRT